MKPSNIKAIRINPVSPFNFDATFHKPDHFTSGDNYWEPGIKWQTFDWNGEKLGVVFKNTGTIDKPGIDVSIHGNKNLNDEFLSGFIEEIKYRYNLELDLKPFYEKFTDDKVLGPVIKRWWGLRPGQPSSLYEYLIIGIVLQNAAVRRSIQMFKALLEKYGTILEYDNKTLYCFWEPGKLKDISEDELRSLKVGYRAKSIKKIDDYFNDGLIDENLSRKESTEKQKEELLKLYGVGPATVWYLMFDVFHRWDTFEHISPWEQKIYTKLFFDKDPEKPVGVEKLLKYISKYKPYRALAVHYLWEDLWWQRKNESIPWLEKLIRI